MFTINNPLHFKIYTYVPLPCDKSVDIKFGVYHALLTKALSSGMLTLKDKTKNVLGAKNKRKY